jgi:hypothetical protein
MGRLVLMLLVSLVLVSLVLAPPPLAKLQRDLYFWEKPKTLERAAFLNRLLRNFLKQSL